MDVSDLIVAVAVGVEWYLIRESGGASNGLIPPDELWKPPSLTEKIAGIDKVPQEPVEVLCDDGADDDDE